MPVRGGGMQQREKEWKTEETTNGETWLLIAVVEGDSYQEERVMWKHWGGMGCQNIFCIRLQVQQQQRYRFHTGSLGAGNMYPLRSQSQTLLVFLLHNRTTSLLWLGTFKSDIFILPEGLSFSWWIPCKKMWKVKFWSTCPWIIIICRIRAVTAFSFPQILETGVQIENRYHLGHGNNRMLQPGS